MATRLRLTAALCALGLTLLAGCTTTVTVNSDPEGAMISNRAGTIQYGYAPVDVPFDKKVLEETIDPTDPMRCAKLQGFTAEWKSGAKAQTETPLAICDLKFGEKIMLKRPKDVPGVEEDLRWALDRAQKRALDAERERDRLETYVNTPMFFFWHP